MYSIADLRVEACGCGDRFGRQAEKYAARESAYGRGDRETADISVCVTDDVLIRARGEAGSLSEDDCRYLLSGIEFYLKLLKYDGLMLHSSAVVVDGAAYLFSASSGVGKSTHAGLWLEKFGSAAYILNDDKPAIRNMDGRWYAYGTPWSGKCDISRNARARIGGIAFIERAETNSIERVGGLDAFTLVMSQTIRHIKSERLVALLELIERLTGDVPIYRLRCKADLSAAELAYQIMSKGVR